MLGPLFDLRFVIGVFFAIFGLVLLTASFYVKDSLGSGVSSSTIDLVTGAVMMTFGVGMLVASQLWKAKT